MPAGFLTIRATNSAGIVRNLHAQNLRYVAFARAVTRAYGGEGLSVLQAITPVDLGNMRRLARVWYTPQETGFSLGWDAADFTAEGLRWYVPYVLLGTSRMAARPVHLQAMAMIAPRYKAALGRALRDA